MLLLLLLLLLQCSMPHTCAVGINARLQGWPAMALHALKLYGVCLPCCVVHRFLAGVLLRGWAASEAITSTTLMERLTGITAESGQAACEWRYTALRSLSRVVLSPDGSAAAPEWEAVAQQVATAVRAGPYGVGAAERTAAAAAPQSMAV
jgi:hypothetical protein